MMKPHAWKLRTFFSTIAILHLFVTTGRTLVVAPFQILQERFELDANFATIIHEIGLFKDV